MFITISDRYMTKDQLLTRSGVPYLSCGDAYDKKDALKALGFRFNRTNKHWEIKIDPNHFMDLCAETAITCELTVSELEQFLVEIGTFQESPRSNGFSNEFTVDGLYERYNAYCDRIGY